MGFAEEVYKEHFGIFEEVLVFVDVWEVGFFRMLESSGFGYGAEGMGGGGVK